MKSSLVVAGKCGQDFLKSWGWIVEVGVGYTVGMPWIVEPDEWGPEGQAEYIQGLNRDHARREMRAWINAKLAKMREEVAAQEKWMEKAMARGCDFCRGLPIGGGYDLKYDAERLYGLKKMGDEWLACPECGRQVASWDD